MQITTLAQLENAKKLILEMKAQTTHPYVISVFETMLGELDKNDVENVCTPTFLSITNFGYDIFSVLPRMGSR